MPQLPQPGRSCGVVAENTLTQTAVVGTSPHPQVLRGVVEAGARCRAACRAAIWEEEQKGFAWAAWLEWHSLSH